MSTNTAASTALTCSSGSGVVSAFLAALLGPVPSCTSLAAHASLIPVLLATDLNPHACAATVRTAAANSVRRDTTPAVPDARSQSIRSAATSPPL